jgi:L-fuculose-phosphate aldolase
MDARQIIVQAGKDMFGRGLTVETWGNISVRDPGTGLIYLTPSGMPYNTLTPEDVVVLNPDGSILQGSRKPSVERMMHVRIYQARPDVNAVLHTHPVASTVFAALRRPIPVIIDEQAAVILGTCEVSAYALPGTEELADNVVAALGKHNACLIANHGTVCVGADMSACFKVSTVLETAAKIYQKALAVGRPVVLDEENIAAQIDFAQHHYGQNAK